MTGGGGGYPFLPHPPYRDKASQYPSEKDTVEPFGRHNIVGTSDFPLWPFIYIATCHDSLPLPLPPPPTPTLSGAKIRSIPGRDKQAVSAKILVRPTRQSKSRHDHWRLGAFL